MKFKQSIILSYGQDELLTQYGLIKELQFVNKFKPIYHPPNLRLPGMTFVSDNEPETILGELRSLVSSSVYMKFPSWALITFMSFEDYEEQLNETTNVEGSSVV